MFSSLLAAPCELKLHLLQNAIFLRPPVSESNENTPPTATDEVARGLVELYVPSDRKIGGIRVKLRAVQSVAVLAEQMEQYNFQTPTPVGWEDTVLMEKIVEIGMPKSKSHATVPGDDVVNSGERRGRSRAARSRSNTPGTSRAASPDPNAPPEYQAGPEGQSSRSGSVAFTFARAISRGRNSNSRPGSQGNSRSASRNASPVRETSSGTSTALPSPQAEINQPQFPPSPSRATLSRLPSTSSSHLGASTEEVNIAGLTTQLSRTGLSNGRSQASNAHPHDGDREDHYGVPPRENSVHSRGRGGLGSESSGAAAARSATMSPSRTFGRRGRDESKGRFAGIGRKQPRAPSVDTGAAAASTSASADVDEESVGMDLQKGVHGFEFAFILPANSPPFERSPYGRVRYLIKATAFGAGRAKSNLEAWRDLFPVVNPSQDGGPTPLTILYNDMHATVGLISIACTSNNISVGGIFNVDIHSPTPPTDLVVYLVRVSVETSIELRSRKRGRQKVPTQRNKIFEKGYVPPRAKDPHGQGDGKKQEGIIRDPTRPGSRNDDAWTVQGVARMPNDNVVRASTPARTKASIRFTHNLLVEVVHSRDAHLPEEHRKLKVFALRQPITLPSCCVAYDAVSLPAYTPDYDGERPSDMPYDLASHGQGQGIQQVNVGSSNGGPGPAPISTRGRGGAGSAQSRSMSRSRWGGSTATPAQGATHEFCVCGQSIQDLSERERNLLPAVPQTELPLDGLSYRKIGELPERGSNGSNINGGSRLRRTSSRSSSTSSTRGGSGGVIGKRSVSIGRSISRVRSSSSSNTSRRAPSVQRNVGNGGGGSGERGEGVIRTMSRGSRANELPGEAQGHYMSGITNPPTYGEAVVETSNSSNNNNNNNNNNNRNDERSLESVAEDDRRGRMATRRDEEETN